MTTVARASAGDRRGPARAGASAWRGLSRAGGCATEGAPPTPGGRPRSCGPVVACRYGDLRPVLADQCGRPVQRCLQFLLRARIIVKGAPAGRVSDSRTNRARP